MLSFLVEDWAVWGTNVTGQETQLRDMNGGEKPLNVPDMRDFPASIRRRLSPCGRLAMRVAWDLKSNEETQLVFSSRFGDCNQTVALLKDIAWDEPVSPALFSASVHNAHAALMSIACNNKLPHTALSAGVASFGAGLIEAITQALDAPERKILLVYYDEPVSDFYERKTSVSCEKFAVAIKLMASKKKDVEDDHKTLFKMEIRDGQTATKEDPAITFVEFLSGNRDRWVWSDGFTQWVCCKISS